LFNKKEKMTNFQTSQMDLTTILSVVRDHRLMTKEHFDTITGNGQTCKCGYCCQCEGECKCRRKQLIVKAVDDIAYFHKCDLCETSLYHNKVGGMPYPHCDVFLTSYPVGKTMKYWFCARCKNNAIMSCSDCFEKNKDLCDKCSEHLETCIYRDCSQCLEYRK